MTKDGVAPSIDVHEDDVDSCLCDIELHDTEATPDVELPPATGGVEVAQQEHADEDHIDGCDLDFNNADATPDEELPAAVGGGA